MSGDDMKAAHKYVSDNLESTGQTQLLLEPVTVALTNDSWKELLLLLTNRRIVLFRRKTGLRKGISVKRTYSILDIISLNLRENCKEIHVEVNGPKEKESLIIRSMATMSQRALNIIYDSLRLVNAVRTAEDIGSLTIPPRSYAADADVPTQQKLIAELYMTLCDQRQTSPLISFIEFIQNGHQHKGIFDLSRALGKRTDKATFKACVSDLEVIAATLKKQILFNHVLVSANLMLSEDALDAVLEFAFSPSNRMRQISFMGNNWSKGGSRRIASYLKKFGDCAMRDIVILQNYVGDEGLADMVQSAIEGKTQLRSLVLRMCQISGKSDRIFVPLLNAFILGAETGIRTLDLSGNELSKRGSKGIAQFLQASQTLEKLSLAHSGANLDVILEALSSNTNLYQRQLRIMNLSGLKMSKSVSLQLRSILAQTSSLTELSLTRIKLNDFALANIFDAIGNNVNDVKMVIDLGGCSIGSALAKALGDSIRRHVSYNKLEVLSLQSNDISTAEDVIEACDVLVQIPSLKHISFDGNVYPPTLFSKNKMQEIGDALSGLIRGLPNLESFSIAGDDSHWIGDGLIPVFDAISSHKRLRMLDISCNKLTKKASVAFADCLRKSSTLEHVCMNNCQMDSDSMDALADALNAALHLPLRAFGLRDSLGSASSTRKARKLESTLALARAVTARIQASQQLTSVQARPTPASMRRRLQAVERLESSFFEVFDDDSSLEFLQSIVTMSEKQFSAMGSKATLLNASMYPSCSSISSSDKQFGASLKEVEMISVPEYYDDAIPVVLVRMDEYLDRADAADSVGIFRLAPDENESKRVKAELSEGSFKSCSDINSVANNMKVWYREMPEKLLGSLSMEDLQATSDEEVAASLSKMPPSFRSIFEWTLDVFVKYSRRADSSKMNSKNIAIVFSPNLYPTSNDDPMAEMQIFQLVCKFTERAITYREASYDPKRLKACHKALRHLDASARSQFGNGSRQHTASANGAIELDVSKQSPDLSVRVETLLSVDNSAGSSPSADTSTSYSSTSVGPELELVLARRQKLSGFLTSPNTPRGLASPKANSASRRLSGSSKAPRLQIAANSQLMLEMHQQLQRKARKASPTPPTQSA